ncbi:MAG: hypothetical protein K6T73_08410, partial [Candidatus Bathyarchaeota archaeon]|nr:hypothetical protein [Candidatus Bathyarchaeota archaeon]
QLVTTLSFRQWKGLKKAKNKYSTSLKILGLGENARINKARINNARINGCKSRGYSQTRWF